MRFGGLDLSAREKNPSGVCIYPDQCKTLFDDEDILNFFYDIDIVAVDAPLSLEIPWRDSERELIRKGFRPLPLSMESMKELHERAKRLSERLSGRIIETFVAPMRIPLVEVLAKRKGWNKHERDAFLCSLTAKAYEEGRVLVFGKKHPIYIAERSFLEEEIGRMVQNLPPFGKP